MKKVNFKYVINQKGKQILIHDEFDVYMTLDGTLYDSNHDKIDGFPIQYTGRKDDKGDKIYDGDIVKYLDRNLNQAFGGIGDPW